MSTLRKAAQQALEALEMSRRFVYADNRPQCDEAIAALRAALAQQDETAQEQDVEDAIEAAYWHFDARKKGLNEWAYAPQSERDAFKAEARKLVRGYFPTRQAQDTKREMLAVADAFIRGKRAALAQQDEPVARECSDPMCACRGGPCAECEEGEREKEIEDLRSSLYFYQRRCEALQSWQSKMRDPERTIVCDILANGKTLDPAFAGDRYTAPPQQAEPVQEPVAYIHRQGNHWEVSERFLLDDEKARGWTEEPLYTAPPRCPNCASLEAQNTELDRRLAEMEQAYENGYKAGVAAEREECAKVCDFHVARLSAIDEPRPALAVGICAAAIRARGEK